MLRGKACVGEKNMEGLFLEESPWEEVPSKKKQQHGTKSHNVPSIPMETKFASGESQTSSMFLRTKPGCLVIGELQLQPNGLAHWDSFRHNMKVETPSINHQLTDPTMYTPQ